MNRNFGGTNKIWLIVLIALVCETAAMGAVILSPVSVTSSAGENSSTDGIARTIDRSGLDSPFLSGITDFDTYVSTNPIHLTNFSLEWFAPFNVTSSTLQFDLGQVLRVDRLAFWNEDGSGMTSFTASTSNDPTFSTGVTSLGTFFPADNPNGLNYEAEVMNFPTAVDARYVRLDAFHNGTNFAFAIAMGEIAFSVSPVPEPGAFSFILASLCIVSKRRMRSR